MKNPSQHLTTQQLHLLKIIYKFRFVTADLVAKYKKVSTRATNEAFSILLQRKIISRHYDKTYILLGKGARYYLAPQALKLLKSDGLNELALHARYKDRSASEQFIEHCLNILIASLNIQVAYKKDFLIYTKAELADQSYFPRPLPDIYLKREVPTQDMPNEYFIDIFSDSQFFIIKKRIDQYIEHFESGDWGGGNYPNILLACPNNTTAQKILKYVETTLDNKYIDDNELIFKTVLTKDLVKKDKIVNL